MGVSLATRFFASPSRGQITWREPSEHQYELTEPNDWRPLVVIDPEDREQVERLRDAMLGNGGDLVRSLRSLVTPPKPSEPQGLGAVVEDERGIRWTRWTDEEPSAAWKCSLVGQGCEPWEKVAAVKVLAPGWSE